MKRLVFETCSAWCLVAVFFLIPGCRGDAVEGPGKGLDPAPGTEMGVDAQGIVKGLTYYASFDPGFAPDLYGGSMHVDADRCRREPGLRGCGMRPETGPLTMPAPGNYSPRCGTVSFWLRPDWDPEDPDERQTRVFFRGGWVQLCYSCERRRCFFMTGIQTVPEGFRWTYSSFAEVMRHWKPGEWYHLAFTWDAATGHKVIYLDGESVSEQVTSVIADRGPEGIQVAFGSAAAPGIYDEWGIWDRPLSGSEIRELHRHPDRVADSAQALAAARSKEAVHSCPLGVEIPVLDPPVSSIVVPGGVFTARILLTSVTALGFTGDVEFCLSDFRGEERGLQRLRVEIPEQGGKTLAEMTFTVPDERGVFRIFMRVRQAGEMWERDVCSFASWPEPVASPDSETFFGNHVNSWYGGKFVEQAARLGLNWQRNHDMLQATWWNRVQPEPGPFKWTMDDNLGYFSERGISVLGGLTGTPYWAVAGGPKPRSRSPRGYPNPPDLTHWETYVQETVRHFKDRIHCWEIYNEPSVSIFWNGTPEQYAAVVDSACRAIHEEDPNATVMAGGYTSVAWKWQEKAARAGALRQLDALSIHYGTPMLPPEENARKLAEVMTHFRGLAKIYGKGEDIPIWSTEGSTGDTTWFRGLDFPELPPERLRGPLNAELGAVRVVQGSAVLQLAGIVRHFIYLHSPPGQGAKAFLNTSMIDVNWAPRPKLIARAAMQEQLRNTICRGDVRRPDDARFWAVLYEKQGQQTVVLWWVGDGGRAEVRVSWPGTVSRRVDIMGNPRPVSPVLTLTGEPFYVHVDAPYQAVRDALLAAQIDVVEVPVPLPSLPPSDDPPDVPPLPDFVAPAENPAGVFFVDLRSCCNMGFADATPGDGHGGWSDEGPLNDFRDFPTGRQVFAGVPFEVIDPAANAGRSIVTLRGTGATPGLPESVTIPLEARPVRCFYFLHAAAWGTAGRIGSYEVQYADGQQTVIPIEIPGNNGNWWTGYTEGENARPVPFRVENTSTGRPEWRYIRVYEWENLSRVPVSSIVFRSAGGVQTPILVAITGV